MLGDSPDSDARDDEYHESQQVNPLPAHDVRETAHRQQKRAYGERVAYHYPLRRREVGAEVLGDGRERDRDAAVIGH